MNKIPFVDWIDIDAPDAPEAHEVKKIHFTPFGVLIEAISNSPGQETVFYFQDRFQGCGCVGLMSYEAAVDCLREYYEHIDRPFYAQRNQQAWGPEQNPRLSKGAKAALRKKSRARG